MVTSCHAFSERGSQCANCGATLLNVFKRAVEKITLLVTHSFASASFFMSRLIICILSLQTENFPSHLVSFGLPPTLHGQGDRSVASRGF